MQELNDNMYDVINDAYGTVTFAQDGKSAILEITVFPEDESFDLDIKFDGTEEGFVDELNNINDFFPINALVKPKIETLQAKGEFVDYEGIVALAHRAQKQFEEMVSEINGLMEDRAISPC